MIAVGVDGCKAGWVGIAIDHQGFVGAALAPSIELLSEKLPDAGGFGVDMPIGLRGHGLRRADLLARRAIGPRWSSVFTTPPRPVLEEPTYRQANALAVQLNGTGISRQAYGLRAKIFEVERWIAEANAPAWEVHPEVSFATLDGHYLATPKTSWTGAERRRRLLAEVAGIVLPEDLGTAGLAKVDDVSMRPSSPGAAGDC